VAQDRDGTFLSISERPLRIKLHILDLEQLSPILDLSRSSFYGTMVYKHHNHVAPKIYTGVDSLLVGGLCTAKWTFNLRLSIVRNLQSSPA